MSVPVSEREREMSKPSEFDIENIIRRPLAFAITVVLLENKESFSSFSSCLHKKKKIGRSTTRGEEDGGGDEEQQQEKKK